MIRKILEGVSLALFWLCAIIILVMALSVTYEALARYPSKASPGGTDLHTDLVWRLGKPRTSGVLTAQP